MNFVYAATASNHVQKSDGQPAVHDIITQKSPLREVQKPGFLSSFARSETKSGRSDTVVMFAYAAR